MFSKLHRFHGYGSLKAVYQHGQSIRGQSINLKFKQRNDSKPYRVAVVVSSKVSKSAVTRNRIRRRIYEAVRQAGEDIAPGTDLVFTVFSYQVAELPASKLQAAISNLLKQAKS